MTEECSGDKDGNRIKPFPILSMAETILRDRGFPAAADNLLTAIGLLREELAAAYIKASGKTAHASDCATSCAPAEDPGPCDCDTPLPSPVAPLTVAQIEDWRKRIKAKIFDDFCGEPNEAHGRDLSKEFDRLCDMALQSPLAPSRDDVLEEAAKIAESPAPGLVYDRMGDYREIAAAIRSRKGQAAPLSHTVAPDPKDMAIWALPYPITGGNPPSISRRVK
jgi:hypothetical protein